MYRKGKVRFYFLFCGAINYTFCIASIYLPSVHPSPQNYPGLSGLYYKYKLFRIRDPTVRKLLVSYYLENQTQGASLWESQTTTISRMKGNTVQNIQVYIRC